MWHPQSEIEATSDVAALVEWLRATGRWPDAEPLQLHAWLQRQARGEDPALDAFLPLAGITPPAEDAP